MIEMLSLGILSSLLRNLISSAFALPFSGGAVMRIFMVFSPEASSIISVTSFLGLLGITLIRRYGVFGIFIFAKGF